MPIIDPFDKKPTIVDPFDKPRTQIVDPFDKKPAIQKISEFGGTAVKESVLPVQRAYELYKQYYGEGAENVKKAFTDPSLTNTFWGALGALQFTFSPITAGVEALAGEPTEKNLLAAGLSPEAAKFGRDLVENALYFYTPAKAGKQTYFLLGPGAEGMKAGKEAIKAFPKELAQAAPEKAVIEAIKKPEILGISKFKGSSLMRPQVRQEVTEQIAKAADDVVAGNLDKSKRLFKNVADHLSTGEIQVEQLPAILKKHNMAPAQFAEEYVNTISTAGRQLNQLSRLAKRLKATFKDDKEAFALFDDAEKLHEQGRTVMDKVAEGWYRMENFRRGMLVTQMATAARNGISQAGRLTIGVVDEAMQGALRATFGGEGQTLKQIRSGLSTWDALIGKLSKANRNRLAGVLAAHADDIATARLFSAPVHEVTVGNRISNALNTLNRTQEFFFRRLAFEARLRQSLSRKGLNWNSIDPKNIPTGMIDDAVDYALEMTYSKMPKGKFAKSFIEAWSKTPLTTVNPFPRFAFGNAVPFILEHSPFGYLQAVRPEVLRQLASGNPEAFARAASRATTGVIMLDAAIRLKNSEHQGDKWYEIKLGTDPDTGKSKTVDTRAYAPLNFYMFVAEALKGKDANITPMDYAQAVIGMNRVSGTGLEFVDWLRAKNGERAAQRAQNFIGQYLGSFTVPVRTPKDFYTAIKESEGYYRDVKEYPLIGPAAQNIPGLSQGLPAKPSPVKTEQPKAETPLLRQLTGINIRTKTIVESEIDKVGLDYSQVYPRTGVPEADRLISKYMAPYSERLVPKVIKSKKYQEQSEAGKRIILAETFKKIRMLAKAKLITARPDLYKQIKLEGMQTDVKELMKERGILK